MTPQRAQEIIEQAREATICGPWSDLLDDVMTQAERVEVKQVWNEMPGYTCFLDALYRIANAENEGVCQ